MLKRLLTLQATALPYMTMAQALARPLTQGPLARRPVMQRVALGGLIGAGMALVAIALGQRLKRGVIDAPHDPTPFI
ncbi:hypothetical protein [Asticcacaulis endophyticus]|uniref:Uncharacterized protein n=1 Tax=Asticcacaulis endophyticus TaxID=1395890 RepID=A0A918UMZ1_9CAUL|nr:hypothetical protein [Asticcacaulis endophyticus]GGZ21474.1 hypothetical protein GCM10011273_02710 [Asticcacaulis endophyticus]